MLVPSSSREEPPREAELERTAVQQFYYRWEKGDYTIQPDGNKMIDSWDMVVISALFATSILLPVEVGVLETVPPFMYFIGKIIDLIFVGDIFLTFNVAYTIRETATQRPNLDVYERKPLKIASHYMARPFSDDFTAGWFWPDVLTVIPWEAIPTVRNMNSLRLVRVLRLVRMLRLVRVIKLFKRWHVASGFSFSLVKIATCACVTLMLVHWLACVWAHLGLHASDYTSDGDHSWLANHLTSGIDMEGLEVVPRFEVYMSSLYFCTVVLTTVGFGDLVPQNLVEVGFMIATIFLTGITWAWVVANIVNVITNMDVFGTHFNQMMDDINRLMNTVGVTTDVKLRIRRHIHESYNVQRQRHHQHAIHWLSAGLQGELAIESGIDRVCDRIWYFKGVQLSVLIDLADEFKANLFSPNETIMDRNSASVILRGSCMMRGKLFSKDAVIGEDMILVSQHLRDSSCPRTITFLEVMTIHRDSLKEAALKFPDFNVRLRRAQIKLALWRAFVRTAGAIKKKGYIQRHSYWDTYYLNVAAGKGPATSKMLVKNQWQGWVESLDHTQQSRDIPRLEANLEILDVRIQGLFHRADQRSQSLERRVESMEGKLESMDQCLQTVASQLKSLNEKAQKPAEPNSEALSGRFRLPSPFRGANPSKLPLLDPASVSEG